MKQYLRYTGHASTKKEAEALAVSLLQQVVETGSQYTVVTQEVLGGNSERVLLLPTEEEPASPKTPYTPAVYIHGRKEEKDSLFWVYLLSDRDRLPFYYKYSPTTDVLLPLLRPIQKPEKALPVEAILTYEGAIELDALIKGDGGGDYASILEKSLNKVKEAANATEELKAYSLFEDFGDWSLNDIKDALEEGDEDMGGIADASLLNGATGATYKTEKDFLKGLAGLVGKKAEKVVEKYKDRLLSSYRFEKAYRFIDWLTLELVRTEDYRGVEAHYKEYASAIGYKEEYTNALLRKEGKGAATALELALAKSLKGFIGFSSYFDGISDTRVAAYLNAPEDTIRKIYTDIEENFLL